MVAFVLLRMAHDGTSAEPSENERRLSISTCLWQEENLTTVRSHR